MHSLTWFHVVLKRALSRLVICCVEVTLCTLLALQFKTLSYRAFVSYWRNPEYNAVRFAFCIMLGLFLGTIYLFLGERRCVHQSHMLHMQQVGIARCQVGTVTQSGWVCLMSCPMSESPFN